MAALIAVNLVAFVATTNADLERTYGESAATLEGGTAWVFLADYVPVLFSRISVCSVWILHVARWRKHEHGRGAPAGDGDGAPQVGREGRVGRARGVGFQLRRAPGRRRDLPVPSRERTPLSPRVAHCSV